MRLSFTLCFVDLWSKCCSLDKENNDEHFIRDRIYLRAAASLWAGSEGLALLLFAVSAFLNATGTSAALDQLYDRQ